MGELNVVYNLTDFAGIVQSPEGTTMYELVEWKPSFMNVVPSNIRYEKSGFIKNWVFHLPRFFTGQSLYSVFALINNGEILSQCILTPASARYPFMGPGDMQFGLVYTPTEHRNKKLGNALVNAVIEYCGKDRKYWWLTDLDNYPSQKLAQRLGFQLVGKARRETFCGLSYYRMVEEGA